MPGPTEDWQPPTWLTGPKYSTRELMWLCEAQDTRLKELRQVIIQLSAQLEKATA